MKQGGAVGAPPPTAIGKRDPETIHIGSSSRFMMAWNPAVDSMRQAITKPRPVREKLTRKIRNEAGGSETDADVKDIPTAMESAVKWTAELADDLKKLVEKTPRHVVSASVIDQANKLLGLIQHLRYGR